LRYSVRIEDSHIRCEVFDRKTVQETKEFVDAVFEKLRETRMRRVLILIRDSQPIFTVGRYQLEQTFKSAAAMVPGLRVAHVSDSKELQASQDYIALLGRQQGVACRAIGDEPEALRWLLSEEPAV
jgi:hypothetical protein